MSWRGARRRLSSRRLFTLAERLSAYGGMITARARADLARGGPVTHTTGGARRPLPPAPDSPVTEGAEVVTVEQAAAAMPGLFSHVSVKAGG